jgi:hypothetical protein
MVAELRDQYSPAAARKEKHLPVRHEPGTAFPYIGRDDSGRKYLGAEPGRLLAQICTLEPRESISFLPVSRLETDNEKRQEKHFPQSNHEGPPSLDLIGQDEAATLLQSTALS